MKKKDKARMENAQMHSAISVAGLATALAAVAAAGNSTGSSTKMSMAVASATELLASHCIELAESAGAEHDHVASVVRSAVDIQSPGDLMTLTAAAATGICFNFICLCMIVSEELTANLEFYPIIDHKLMKNFMHPLN